MTACIYECIDGWLPVNDGYVEAHMMRLAPGIGESERAAHRAALANSVSPCPSCHPEQYELWRGGHFAPDHACERCKPGRRRKRRAGEPAAVSVPPLPPQPEEERF